MLRSALIFDFFGVVCSEIAPFWLEKYLTPDEAARIKSSIVHAADLGVVSQEELFRQLGDLARVSPNQVEKEWWSYVCIDKDMVELLGELRTTCTLGLLTNSPAPFVRDILRKYNLGPLFDAIVVSSEEGYAKPDRTIYERTLARLSAHAAHALMIDDNPVNVEGAKEAGIGGLLFESCVKLRRELSAANYLASETN